ncbi:dynein regulatory complex protein 11-like [Callorhinchus milii]|uniref:dynein regulatory complex protein 11-like n=1 Tax=Callorhinchus milii TaxID=7868 RepID=UPI001C3F93CA|nr:dynein regulatory complex protein 11-like [Callorhinchus milii]
MSHGAYNNLWREAQAHMNGLLALELSPESLSPPKDLVAFSRQQASLFIHYVQILRKLDQVYDQLANPQKRRLVRSLLDGVMGRVLELRRDMIQRHLSEFIYMDDAIQDLKLTPADFDIPIPKYFRNERARVMQERKKLFSQIMDETAPEDAAAKRVVILTKDEAVRVIQISERARQGRLRAAFMREIWREEQREKRARLLGITTMDPTQAATYIQKVWKGHKQRKITQQLRAEELMFLGMVGLQGVSDQEENRGSVSLSQRPPQRPSPQPPAPSPRPRSPETAPSSNPLCDRQRPSSGLERLGSVWPLWVVSGCPNLPPPRQPAESWPAAL